jgi:RecB family exonuclease
LKFEVNGDAALPDLPGDHSILQGVRVAGRLDRVDRREDESGAELRVVDYKLTLGKIPPTKNLEREALRGRRLQPALYALMAKAREPDARAGAELHFLPPHWREGAERRYAFSLESWETPWAAEMGETLGRLLKGIREGEFYIIPDDGDYSHCSRCPYVVLCRKNHRPTRYRQTADPRTRRIEDLQTKNWPPKT